MSERRKVRLLIRERPHLQPRFDSRILRLVCVYRYMNIFSFKNNHWLSETDCNQATITTTPGLARLCRDKLNECADFGKDACVGIFRAWAEENCPVFCNLCKFKLCTTWYRIWSGVLLRMFLVLSIEFTLYSVNIFVDIQISCTICHINEVKL